MDYKFLSSQHMGTVFLCYCLVQNTRITSLSTKSTMSTTESCTLVPSQQGFLLNVSGYLLAKNKEGGLLALHPTKIWTLPSICEDNYSRWKSSAEQPWDPQPSSQHRQKYSANARAPIRQRATTTSNPPAQIIREVTATMPSTSTLHLSSKLVAGQPIS